MKMGTECDRYDAPTDAELESYYGRPEGTYEEQYCGSCAGSGEGRFDGSTCHACKGSGAEYVLIEPETTDEEQDA